MKTDTKCTNLVKAVNATLSHRLSTRELHGEERLHRNPNQSLKTILIGLQKKQHVAGLHPKLISVHNFKFPHALNHIFVYLTQIF